ncbi:MAG: cobalt transporter CbiM [Clostridiales bacterium]|jgi:cobalt/nickel transport system permease protein|nr:cobalt transporter CbiM [Clostridiales bacterium]
MHIPDNYLSPATCALLGAAAAPVLAISVKKVKEEVSTESMPMLGIGAAFSFLMMMFNVPLPGGTTGHAVGGTLIAIMAGPYSACLAVSAALAIQALLFGDGGILSLGANIFNMAFVLPFAGYFVFSAIKKALGSKKGEAIGAVCGAYIGLAAAALLTAIEFGIQPLIFKDASGLPLYCPYPLSVSIPAMMAPHLLAACVVESAFTVFIYSFVKKVSPGSIYAGEKKRSKAIYALLSVLIILVPLGLLAEGTAWGEWGADEISVTAYSGSVLGFTPKGMLNGFSFPSPLPDYAPSGMPDALGYIISAVFGVAVSIILFRLLGGFLKAKSPGSHA